MKALFLLVTAFILSGCVSSPACDSPAFTTSGIEFCSEGLLSTEEIDILVQTVEKKVQAVYPEVTNIVESFREAKVNVFFVDDYISLNCEEIKHGVYRCEKHIGGVTIDEWSLYVRYRSCLAHTSLAHELMHVIEYHYLDGPQGEDLHSTPYFFSENYANQERLYSDMIEARIRTELRTILPSCQ